jgi:N-formylglutamate deformylase
MVTVLILHSDICPDRLFDAAMDGHITSPLGPDTPSLPDAGSAATPGHAPALKPPIDQPLPFRLLVPAHPFSPVVFTSPHSGRDYSADLMVDVRLPPPALRRSEDCFVDELFDAAPENGAPLLAATFPRAFCDVNREAWELDPAMFADPLPDWVNTGSSRVAAGLGTIARVVASGETIYGAKLSFKEAQRRIFTYWRPFHDQLARLVGDIKDRFGYCLVIDCHSMPSNGQGRRPADFILGDLHGAACASRVTRMVEGLLQSKGYLVRRNDPYAGGYITRHYGRPGDDVHVLQIEIARGLYMDEARLERLDSFAALRKAMAGLVAEVTRQSHDLIG